jgi:hypothetical protein
MFASGVIANINTLAEGMMADSKGPRAMRHPIWDSHLALRISTLEHQKLIVLRKTIRPDPLQFVIAAIALQFIPLKSALSDDVGS